VATTSPISSGLYTAGRPERGRSANPFTPSRLKRLSQSRTVAGHTPNVCSISATLAPYRDNSTIRARSTVRAGAVRERANWSIAARSSPKLMRARNGAGTGHLLPKAPSLQRT
jgi:hypothetical protein